MSYSGDLTKKKIGPIEELWKEAVNEVVDLRRSYSMNSKFMMGNQWLYEGPEDGQIFEIEAAEDRYMATINRIRSNGRTLMANLTQRELSFEVPPVAGDDASQRAARKAEAVLRDLSTNQRWERVREELCLSTLMGGAAGLAVEMDPEAKVPIIVALPPIDFVVEPGAPEAETAVWWIKRQLLPPKRVKQLFGMSKEPPGMVTGQSDPYDDRTRDKKQTTTTQQSKVVPVYTYYRRPFKGEKGAWKVEVNGEIVDQGDWFFPFNDRLNLVVSVETVIPGVWYGGTIMDDVRQVQVLLNQGWSTIAEHVANVSNPRWGVPSSIYADFVGFASDRPGEMFEINSAEDMPIPMEAPAMANWVIQFPPMLEMEIDNLMGVHDVSRGEAPANVESGYGLSILAEKDASPVGRLIKETARVFSEAASMVLQTYEKHVKRDREITINMGLGPEKYSINGKDLQGQTKAKVPLDAIVPRSQAAMQAMADRLLQMQVITSPIQFVRVADLPGQEDVLGAISPDYSKARRENEQAALGEIQLPANFDVHEIHIETHEDFAKTERYEEMPTEDRKAFLDHIQVHRNMQAEAKARELEMMVAEQQYMQNQGVMPPNESGAEEPNPGDAPPEASVAAEELEFPPVDQAAQTLSQPQ